MDEKLTMTVHSFKFPCRHSHDENEKEWIVDIKGEPESESFEISVIKSKNCHGRDSYGWFDDGKLLISHNGSPCRWGVTKSVWEKLIKVANEVCGELNETIVSSQERKDD